MYAMKCVLDPFWRGGSATSDETIGWFLEDLGMSLDDLRSTYEQRAQEALDQEAAERIAHAERAARKRAVGESLKAERSQFTYTFPAVAGTQAGRAFYAAQVPYAALVKFFRFDEEDSVPAELRAQRVMSERRGARIGEYIVDNPTDYVLPALTASVSAEMRFEPMPVAGAAGSVGLLHIPMEATMLLNDGQHRRRGIELALAKRPRLAYETVVVTMFFDQGLKRSQQMFADINGQAVKPSAAINALYDARNPFNSWVLHVMALAADVGSRIDVENSSVGAKSYKLWSLVVFKRFLTQLTGVTEKNIDAINIKTLAAIDSFLVEFFAACGRHIPKWSQMLGGEITASEIREQFVIGHAVWLEALALFARRALFDVGAGGVGAATDAAGVVIPGLAQWHRLERLSLVDPRKTSLMWNHRCVVLGKMQKTSDGVRSTAAKLMQLTNIALPNDMRELESRIPV